MVNLIPWKRKRKEENGGAMTTRQLEPLAELREEMDSLFERFFQRGFDMDRLWKGWPTEMERPWPERWGLEVDDRPGEMVVRAEAPGFDPEEFELEVRGNRLVIHAEHKEESSKKNEWAYSYGSFHRMVPLPEGIEEEKIDARYRRGVLEIKLPKSEHAKGKRITVSAS